MASKPDPMPSFDARAVQMPAATMDQVYFRLLASLVRTVNEQSAQIETLRVALNETRANPTTVYPAVPAF